MARGSSYGRLDSRPRIDQSLSVALRSNLWFHITNFYSPGSYPAVAMEDTVERRRPAKWD